MRGSPSLSSVLSDAILSRISPTSWALVLVDCRKIECRWPNVSGPSPVLYLSRFDFRAWICWSPGILVIEGIWKYSCMTTLIAHCPPGLVMPRGGGAPGILHTGPCLLTFCFDPPSPVILRLCVSVGRCPSSSRVGSRGRSYVSFCLPRLIMLWAIQFRILGISIWPKSNWDRPREISIAKSSVKKPQSTPASLRVPCWGVGPMLAEELTCCHSSDGKRD